MATGWMMKGVCYAVQQDAIDAYFQAIPPTVLLSSTTSYVQSYVRTATPAWQFNKQTFSSTGAITNNYSVAQANPVMGACTVLNDPVTNFSTGMSLGWAIAAAMVVVYVIRRPHR